MNLPLPNFIPCEQKIRQRLQKNSDFVQLIDCLAVMRRLVLIQY